MTSEVAEGGRRKLPPSVVLFVALSFANGSNYLFQVVMSRLLGPADYSLLGGVYAIITVVAVSTQALQTASAKVVAAHRVTGGEPERDTLTAATIRWGLILTAVGVAASPLIARFFHAGIGPILGLWMYIVPAGLLAIGLGRLQGLEAFLAFSVVSVALALGRLTLGPVAFALGLGVTGVVLAGAVVSAIAAVWALRRTRDAGGATVSALRGDIRRAGAALILFWVMASIDVPLARNSLNSHDAGVYAAASVIGKAIIWLPSALTLVMFPRVTSRRERGEHTHPPLVRAFAATVVLCAAGVVALRLLGSWMIPLVFGESYREAVPLAWRVGLACLPFALGNLLVFYHLTRDTGRFLIGVVASLVVEVVAMAAFHDSAEDIVAALGIGSIALLLCLLVPGVIRRAGIRAPSWDRS